MNGAATAEELAPSAEDKTGRPSSQMSNLSDDFDKPHFNYPYEEEEAPQQQQQQSNHDPFAELSALTNPPATAAEDQAYVSPFRVGLAGADADPLISTESSKPLINGFDDLLGDFTSDSTPPPATNQMNGASDPFDLFGSPPPAVTAAPDSKAEKDPFDLFG